jgi:hypothetical protein
LHEPDTLSESQPEKQMDSDVTQMSPIDESQELIPIQQPVVAERVKPEPTTERKIEISTAYQLIPYVFFAPGSSTLDTILYNVRCQKTKDPDYDFGAIVDTALSSRSYTEKHYRINQHVLNIIGYRMTVLYPDARLMLYGYRNGRSSDNVAGIEAARARAVESYLRDCWRVEPERLVVVSQCSGVSPSACTYALREQLDIQDAEAENSRCQLVSPNEPMLLAPAVAQVSIVGSQPGNRGDTSIVRLCAIEQPAAHTTQLLQSVLQTDGATTGMYTVTGYADRKGPDNINERISEQRARKAAALMSGAAGKVAIDWIGEGARGMRAPYTNENPVGRLLNRCAEVRRVPLNQQP